ncbi:hypothetical protein ACJJTC_016284 [Scirpophaga incertulas]
MLNNLSKQIVPNLTKKSKGDAGRIAIIGGSADYSGATYFAAMSSSRVGADLVFVMTTEAGASIIKTYSPDLLVYAHLNRKNATKISQFLRSMDVVVIGPGFGQEDDQINLMLDIIRTCKVLKKALVIDGDALIALSYNVDILKNYPSPGVILTPNFREAASLRMAVKDNDTNWYNYWDDCLGDEMLSKGMLNNLSKQIVPNFNKKTKGEAGKIAIVGGSAQIASAPYFAGISSLRVGADLVFVFTTDAAAPIVKAYSPDLIVHPYLSKKHASKITQFVRSVDVVVLGPGFGREDNETELMLDIIQTCRNLTKALVLDADGLLALSNNVDILKNYPSPGVILTPNFREASRLKMAVKGNDTNWYNYWGENVSVLLKGYEDKCYTSNPKVKWSLLGGGSIRRGTGQGDILAGALGTFYNWALKSNLCDNSIQVMQSVAMYCAAKFTKACNARAYDGNGRNMIASDMLKKMHLAFNDVFEI